MSFPEESDEETEQYVCLDHFEQRKAKFILGSNEDKLCRLQSAGYEIAAWFEELEDAKKWLKKRLHDFSRIEAITRDRDAARRLARAASAPKPPATPKRKTKPPNEATKKGSPTSVADPIASPRRPPKTPPVPVTIPPVPVPAPPVVETRKSKKLARKAKEKEREESRQAAKKEKRKKKKASKKEKAQKSKKSRKKKSRRSRSSSSSSSSGTDSDDDDSSGSSGSSSESDGNSSSSSSSSEECSDRKAMKKKAARMAKLDSDPSIGQPDALYGLPTTGPTIDLAMGPQGLKPRDFEQLAGAALDILNLPGTSNAAGDRGEKTEEPDSTATLVATVMAANYRSRRSGVVALDPQWKAASRTRVQRVANRAALAAFVGRLEKCEKSSFKQEKDSMASVLRHRMYSEGAIKRYYKNGLLPRITRESFRLYWRLLSMIRTEAYKYDEWENSPASAMLAFHTEKLMDLRMNAISKKQLLYMVYIYLRESSEKGFYHESLTASLWTHWMDVKTPTTESSGGGAGATSKCSHCRGADLHAWLGKKPIKGQCPLGNLSQAKARKAAVSIQGKKRADEDADVRGLVDLAKVEFA